jgi:ribosomal-protein-alanine N-acetyltransferase
MDNVIPRTPTLETRRLCLAVPSIDEVDALVRLWGDPDVTRYLPPGRPVPEDRARAGWESFIAHWQEHGFGPWSLFLKADDTWVGYCGLRHLPGGEEIELLYAIDKRWWGRNLTTEAARLAVEDGFGRVGLDRIVAVALPANIASIQVMKNVGMRYEKDGHLFNSDVVFYSIQRPSGR